MTDREINTVIFESTGWKYLPPKKRLSPFIVFPDEIDRWKNGRKVAYRDDIPDYVNDLNAMHEAEMTLTNSNYPSFCGHLYDSACKEQLPIGKWRWLSPTARQRAEAYMRARDLWK